MILAVIDLDTRVPLSRLLWGGSAVLAVLLILALAAWWGVRLHRKHKTVDPFE